MAVCLHPETKELREREVVLELGGHATHVARVIVDLVHPGGPAFAAFELSDERDGAIAGGITIVVAAEQVPDTPPAPDPQRPCAIVLASPLRVLGLLAAPDEKAAAAQLGRARGELFVAEIVNPSGAILDEVVVNLEHLGGLTFDGPIYNLGTMTPGERFLCVWEVESDSGPSDEYPASIVAQAGSYEPARLRSSIRLIDPRHW